jgi:hypothetical protein
MVPFEFFQAAVIGHSISEFGHADRENYFQNVEQHAKDVEDYASLINAEYEKLRLAYIELQEHAVQKEVERDDLQAKLQLVVDQYQLVQAKFDEFKEQFEMVQADAGRILQREQKKLEAYPMMKKLLVGLFDGADRVFTNEISEEYREKVKKFLAGLP